MTVRSITDQDVSEFLDHGTRTAKLSYVATDGRPLVAPIWFIRERGELVLNTGKNTAKG
jgi:nitroimidazol reductase NimA-like FMN-containing flavoprotein (pyridoxamine 5'-phosphate oxidase superfamily)